MNPEQKSVMLKREVEKLLDFTTESRSAKGLDECILAVTKLTRQGEHIRQVSYCKPDPFDIVDITQIGADYPGPLHEMRVGVTFDTVPEIHTLNIEEGLSSILKNNFQK